MQQKCQVSTNLPDAHISMLSPHTRDGCFCVRGADFLRGSSSGVGKGKRERKGVVPAVLVACLYKSTPKSRQWHLKNIYRELLKSMHAICLNFSTKCAKLVAELKYLEYIAKIGIKASS